MRRFMHKDPVEREEQPPIFGTWPRLYAAVVLYTFAFVAFLYWITRALNR